MVWYHTTAMMPVELMRRIKSFNTTVGGIGKQWTQRRKPVAPCFVTRRFFWTNEEIANEGSIARDILATERTFLAWARTGLGFVGAGSALAAAYHRQDRKLAPEIAPAATLLIGNGSFLLLFATRRYYTQLSALRQNKFLINTYDTLLAVGFTSLNTIASLIIVWRAEWKKTSDDEKE